MEYRIGQIFEMDGIWYQFVRDNSNGCNSCVFHTRGCKCVHPQEGVRCGSWERRDETDGHFVRLLPLGGEYEQGGDKWQQYKCIEKPNTEDKRVYIAHTDSEVGLIVSIRLTSSNDMESEMSEIKNENLSNSENIGKNLKPFDLQAAKAGKPVCTRSGKPVRIICFDVKGAKHPIIALVKEDGYERVCSYIPDGRRFEEEKEWSDDLMMIPEKKEGWVNLYRDEESKRVYCGEFIFSEREKAEKHYECNDTKVATVPVNWEE